jgi:hypothetical protein
MPPSNLGCTRTSGRPARSGGTRRCHGRLARVEPKARSGGPFFGAWPYTVYRALGSHLRHRRAVAGGEKVCAAKGFFLGLRHRRGTAPRLLRP